MTEEKTILNLVEFYLDVEDEDIEDINNELESAGINPENSEEKILALIKRTKTELKIENGKNFKKKFYSLWEECKSKIDAAEIINPELAVAFRNLEQNGSPDLLDDKQKMLLLEFLKKQENRK